MPQKPGVDLDVVRGRVHERELAAAEDVVRGRVHERELAAAEVRRASRYAPATSPRERTETLARAENQAVAIEADTEIIRALAGEVLSLRIANAMLQERTWTKEPHHDGPRRTDLPADEGTSDDDPERDAIRET